MPQALANRIRFPGLPAAAADRHRRLRLPKRDRSAMRAWNRSVSDRLPTGASAPASGEVVVREAVRRAQLGDAAGLGYLYARFADDVRRRVARVLRDGHDAEDLTQEIFARLPRTIRHYEDRGLPFGGWLMRVAHNAALDELRRPHDVPLGDVYTPVHEDEPSIPEDVRSALALL